MTTATEFKSSAMRVPPQNLDAEKALLGAIMMRPQSIHDISDILQKDAFYSEKHKIIYATMLELLAKNEPIDMVVLSAKLKEKKLLDNIGGASYLTQLVTTVPSTNNVEHYARLIQKSSTLRNLIEAADHISNLGYGEADEVDQVIDAAEKKIFNIGNASIRSKFVDIGSTLEEAWTRLDRLHHSKNEVRGVKTGFHQLDNKLAGLQKSDLIILAARPSMGKTTLAMDIARNAALLNNIPVGIFSLEMSSQQLVDRMLAAESNVDAWKLRTGQIESDDEFSLIRDTLEKLSKAPLYIDDESSNNIIRMKSVARRLKSEHGLGLIVVDYLQLMHPSKNYDSMVHQVTEISRALKGLARDLDVPVLALSQLSRAVEQRGGEPRLSDLRDSGSIEQDADVVLFIHREDKQDKSAPAGISKIIIAKHRNGPTGEAELFFDQKRVSFMNIDKSDHGASGFGDF
ncbi:MAG: replicative DNA helicase [bacterium]|nr:replicative DNA helicase [bacterium]